MSTALTTKPQVSALADILTRIWKKASLSKALGIYILCILYKYRNSVYGVPTRTDIPGPRGIPLLGNIYMVMMLTRSRVLQRQTENHAKYGKIYAITVPGVGRVLNISDPEMVDHVLRVNFWAYEKGPFMRNGLAPLVGGGIFAADGEHWKWQRKLASHIFNVKAFRHYTSEVFIEEAQRVINYLATKAGTGEVVDLQDLFYKYTLDSFGEIAFGQSFGTLEKPADGVPFAKAFDRLNHALSERMFVPTAKFREWKEGRAHEVEDDAKTVGDYCYKVIQDRRKNGSKSDRKDLMQLFMDAVDEDGKPLTDEALKDTLNNFILAGRDTTAQALSWTFYLLHRNEAADRKNINELVSETDRVLNGGLPSYESTKQQKYAEACFYEALRLYPSVPKNIKTCVEDDVLPGGYKVYKNEKIGWSSYAMGRDTSIWGPDAVEYKPERWLTGEKPSPSKFVAFHVGPRTCLGQQFATIEAITIMSMLMQKFSFELVEPGMEPQYLPSLTLPMAHGLPVRVKRRSTAESV